MHPSLLMLAAVARRLGSLREELVFVGGATVPLFLTDPAAPVPRATQDVDVIVEVASRVKYYALSEKLRERGFHEDVDADILCRWRMDDFVLDVMPTDSNILGFSNVWYLDAIATSHWVNLEPELAIRLVSSPHFLATKIEAFNGRGRGDFLGSRDMEDIISLIDGRAELVGEVAASSEMLRGYLANQFRAWLGDYRFMDALPGHLASDDASQARIRVLMERMREFIV